MIGFDFKVGDLVVFKKNNQGILLEGKITEINNNTAVIEYIDPNEPNKTKEYILEMDKLTKIEKVKNKSDLELNMLVIFKKANNDTLREGKITELGKTRALIEYSDPAEPTKVKECDLEFSRIYKISNPVKQEVKVEIKTKELPKTIKNEFEIGDFVKFKKLTGNEIEGKIIAIKENMAEVEYTDPAEPLKSKSIEKSVNELTKIKELAKVEKEKVIVNEEKSEEKKGKTKSSYLKNTISIDVLQFAFKRASIWYEFKPKELIGIRIPVYINWKDLIYSIGINPKFYFNKNKLIQGFAGPEIIGSIKPYQIKSLTIYYLDFLADVGISINPIKNFNITVNCGAGLNIDLGNLQTKTRFSYFPGVSLGYNF